MPVYEAVCLQCGKLFRNTNTELLRYCSAGCTIDAAKQERAENERDQITVNILPMVDARFTYKQLEDLRDRISYILHERREKRFKDLGYEKPGPHTLTVGNLIGLNREE